MRRQRAAVFYTHPLFGRGIAQLLSKEPGLEVVPVRASLSEVPRLATELDPALIIIEDSANQTSADKLVDALSPVVVIFVSLGSDVLRTYKQRKRVWPPPSSLSAALAHLESGALIRE